MGYVLGKWSLDAIGTINEDGYRKEERHTQYTMLNYYQTKVCESSAIDWMALILSASRWRADTEWCQILSIVMTAVDNIDNIASGQNSNVQ